MKEQTITINVELKYKLTFWDAIKLRMAGKNYKIIAEAVMKALESGLKH